MRTALAILALAGLPSVAFADDECEDEADCRELYGEGYVCVGGSLGNYCAPEPCAGDSECRELYGPEAYCDYLGSEARCIGPEAPRYVPPFKSMCSAAGPRSGEPVLWWLVGAGVLATVARRRRPQV